MEGKGCVVLVSDYCRRGKINPLKKDAGGMSRFVSMAGFARPEGGQKVRGKEGGGGGN